MEKRVREILTRLIEILAPSGMPKNEVAKLRKATNLGESTIRTARRRERISADTLVRLLLAHGVAEEDILGLPRRHRSPICPTLTDWNRLGALPHKNRKESLYGIY